MSVISVQVFHSLFLTRQPWLQEFSPCPVSQIIKAKIQIPETEAEGDGCQNYPQQNPLITGRG